MNQKNQTNEFLLEGLHYGKITKDRKLFSSISDARHAALELLDNTPSMYKINLYRVEQHPSGEYWNTILECYKEF